MERSTRQPPVRPPLQERSRRTLNALLDGLDRLLRDRPFESITVLDLAREAKVSTGAFYARFASKDDLLPELYSRFQDSLRETTDHDLDPASWAALSPLERLERLAGFLCDTYQRRSWLLRAVTIHSRRRYSPTSRGEPTPPAQVEWLRRIGDCLEVDPALRDDLTRDEIEFAVYVAVTLTREAVLFPHLPMARSLGLNAETIRERLPGLLQKQLGLSPATS
jgi:AcrR family transcriptional regulator